ncbi:MAG: CPBP family intramembrane metalloprotease [Candidatus Omnitrophica bacterium]|nr:CPBP family intramembrane metalloprotease [Candidatus Omnitrophota bacterium]
MKIKTRDWFIFVLLAILSFGFWYKLEYPRFSFVNLAVNKQQALLEADNYLRAKGIDTKTYSKAIVFDSDERFNRYLQHAAGLKAEEEFIGRHDFDLFRWLIRFFKEFQKEEYFVYLSPRSGKIIEFVHIIEDIEPRIDLGKEAAKQKAEIFLQGNFNIDLGNYDFHEEKVKRYEKRIEYVFSWEKKNAYIPWRENQGGAKLLAEVTVAGNEIRKFSKNKFELPDKFTRYVQKQFLLGEYIYNIFYVILFALLACSISIVLKKRQDIIPRVSKRWFYYAAGFLMVINTADFLNNLQNIFMNYPTSVHLNSFLGLSVTKWIFNTGFLVVGFIMPGIAGESLCAEVFPENGQRSFWRYIKSGFLNRSFTKSILLGYLVSVIILGAQAIIFYNGQKFLGVWREWNTVTYFSSSFIPLFSALVIGASASFNEEIIFRVFGISLAKKYLHNLFLVVLVTSVVWGMGHTMYAIFPVWFRIIEVTIIGILYGYVFVRFGIIPLIVAHYLFDVFWCSAVYLLGKNSGYLFYTAAGLLCIPLVLAFIAYCVNRPEQDRPVREMLDKTQKYNLGVLVAFISLKKSQGYSVELVRDELIHHNWDNILVESAIKEVFDE